MEQTYERIAEIKAYYLDKADKLSLPEEYIYAEELADKIWHLEEVLEIIRQLNYDEEG